MKSKACTDYRGTHLIDGAGHWVQQEQPAAVVEKVQNFLSETS
jgi:pimeloyl-ACP methyl ester carboxylesterase